MQRNLDRILSVIALTMQEASITLWAAAKLRSPIFQSQLRRGRWPARDASMALWAFATAKVRPDAGLLETWCAAEGASEQVRGHVSSAQNPLTRRSTGARDIIGNIARVSVLGGLLSVLQVDGYRFLAPGRPQSMYRGNTVNYYFGPCSTCFCLKPGNRRAR